MAELPHTLQVAIQDYHDWGDDYYRAIERHSRITTPLYHYTDRRGLEGILKSETVWATDYRHLTDTGELLHGLDIAKRLLKRRFDEGGIRSILYQWIDDLVTQKNFGRALEFFIASFSRNRNEIGRWREYADDGRGVAIGFSPRLFAPHEVKNEDPRKNSFAGPVLYRDS